MVLKTLDVKLVVSCEMEMNFIIFNIICFLLHWEIGYEPADLTVHPPPPKTMEGGFIFFV